VFAYKKTEDVVDERVEQNIHNIYNKGFIIVVISGALLYFISTMFHDYSAFLLTPNTSINSMFSLCIFLSFISIRKNKMTFNHTIIENNKKKYYLFVFKNILKFLVFMVMLALVINSFRLFGSIIISNINTTSLAVGITFLSMSFQYFLFSIYEKLHYDELVERDEGKYRYLSKKTLYIFVICFIYMTMFHIVYGVVSYIEILSDPFDFLFSGPTNIKIVFVLLKLYFLLYSFTFMGLALVNRYLIRNSIREVVDVPKVANTIYINFIWIIFTLNMLIGLGNILSELRVYQLLETESIQMYFVMIGTISGIQFIFNLLFMLAVFMFMLIKNIKYKWLYLSTILIMTVIHKLTYQVVVLNDLFSIDDNHLRIFINNVSGYAISLVGNILLLIVVIKLTRTIKYKENEDIGEPAELPEKVVAT